MSESAEDLLYKAKIRLTTRFPFFSYLLLNGRVEEKEGIPTACTDGKNIYFSKEFLESLSFESVSFVLAHEVLHKCFLHAYRLNGRDPKIWNMAADYVINQILIAEGFVMPPEAPGLLDPTIKATDCVDEVYIRLIERNEDSDKAEDHLQFGELGPAEQKQAEMEMDQQMKSAASIAKQAGKQSALIRKIVEELTKPKIDWRKQLREFMSGKDKSDVTWRRPNRRLMAHDVYVPMVEGNAMGEIVIAFDTSGSIYSHQETSDVFMSEINGIIEDLRPEKVHFVHCDASVKQVDEFDQGEPPELELQGGGGTRFSPVFDWLEEAPIDPECLVYFTDLYCDDFGAAPEVPVMWAVYDNSSPGDVPFGLVLPIED
ncbi:MAG: hypothetical protein GY776_06965 [Alteromonas sp.]|nr:hypothetical protein [Alteromonas sp.]